MSILNMTPHAVSLVVDGETITIEPCGQIARVNSSTVKVGEIEVEGKVVALNQTVFGDVIGVPEQTDDVFIIVSRLVKTALPSRSDLICPDGQIRNEQGQVIGCSCFSL